MGRIRVSDLAKKKLEKAADETGSTQRELASMILINGTDEMIKQGEEYLDNE